MSIDIYKIMSINIKNNVLFVGKEKQLKTLKDMLKSKDNDFDFNNIIPMPKNILDWKSVNNPDYHSPQCPRKKR